MYEEIKTACLYLRYSSSNQTEQSIEGQMHVCQDFCKRHNIRIVEMYIDRATSASKDIEKRVEFLKMIKDSEKGNFNAVIVYKLDRFARSRYDSATYKYRLKRNGVQLISATENITQDPEGIILESVLEGMAEFYSAELSQKINRGMRESAMKHNSIGGAIPLGYKTVDKKLVIDETTAPIVREAFQMYADGESVAEICRTFNNRGYKTSKGTRFGKSSFTKIFRNEKYIGVYKYHDYRAEDVIPPIIDKDLWDRVQVRVGKIKKAPARNKARHTYLLTGKLFCGHCGSAMNADGNSQGYLYYRCYGKKNLDKQCNKRNMEKNLIERLVAQDAMSFLTDEYIEKIATIACDRNKQEIESDSPIPVIRDRIRQVDVSLNNLLKAIETGSAPDMLVKRMGELETEKKDMEVQLKKEMAHQVYIDKEQVIFWLEKFREGDINDEEFCQTVIDLFVNSVTVWDEPDDKFKITIAYNLTSIPQKTYRLSKDGRLSDYASNTPVCAADIEDSSIFHNILHLIITGNHASLYTVNVQNGLTFLKYDINVRPVCPNGHIWTCWSSIFIVITFYLHISIVMKCTDIVFFLIHRLVIVRSRIEGPVSFLSIRFLIIRNRDLILPGQNALSRSVLQRQIVRSIPIKIERFPIIRMVVQAIASLYFHCSSGARKPGRFIVKRECGERLVCRLTCRLNICRQICTRHRGCKHKRQRLVPKSLFHFLSPFLKNRYLLHYRVFSGKRKRRFF